MALTEADGRITFANQLRGLAVLFVMGSHYLGTYWGSRTEIAQHLMAPAPDGNPLPFFYFVSFFPGLNYGPLGVALFFLISGFVIPFSLEKMGAARFVVARLMRIYPTYWVGLTITLTALWLSARYWGQAFHLDHSTWLANMLLLHMQLGKPSLDDVNWTLAVELKFYIVTLVLWPLLVRAPVRTIIGFSWGLLGLLAIVPAAWCTLFVHNVAISVDMSKIEFMSLPFLFIGTLFHFAFRGRISRLQLAGAVAAVMAAFVLSWPQTLLAGQLWWTPPNYLYALLLFSGAYALRNRFRPMRGLDFLAAISYPLYVVHCLMGYAVIRILMDRGWGNGPALGAAALAAVCIAWLLHRLVEMPTAHWGKRWGRGGRPPPQVAST